MPVTTLKASSGCYKNTSSTDGSLQWSTSCPAGRRKSGYASFHSISLFTPSKSEDAYYGKKIVVDKAVYYMTHTNGGVKNSWVTAQLTTTTNNPVNANNKGSCGGHSISTAANVTYAFTLSQEARNNLAIYLENGTQFGIKSGSTNVGLVYFNTTKTLEITWHYDYSMGNETDEEGNIIEAIAKEIGETRYVTINSLNNEYPHEIGWGFLNDKEELVTFFKTEKINFTNVEADANGYYNITEEWDFKSNFLEEQTLEEMFQYFPANSKTVDAIARIYTYSNTADGTLGTLLGTYDVKIPLSLRNEDACPQWNSDNIFLNLPIDKNFKILEDYPRTFLTELTGIKLSKYTKDENNNIKINYATVNTYSPAKLSSIYFSFSFEVQEGEDISWFDAEISSFGFSKTGNPLFHENSINTEKILNQILINNFNLESCKLNCEITLTDSRGQITIINSKNDSSILKPIIIQNYLSPFLENNLSRMKKDDNDGDYKKNDIDGTLLYGDIKVYYTPITFYNIEDEIKGNNKILHYTEVEEEKSLASYITVRYFEKDEENENDDGKIIERNIAFSPHVIEKNGKLEELNILGDDDAIATSLAEESIGLLKCQTFFFKYIKEENIPLEDIFEKAVPLDISFEQATVNIYIEDLFKTLNDTIEISAASFMLFFGLGGKTLGIGGAPDISKEKRVTFFWDTEFEKEVIFSDGMTLGGSYSGLAQNLASFLIPIMYPVNSLYFTIDKTNPADGVFKGSNTTWMQVETDGNIFFEGPEEIIPPEEGFEPLETSNVSAETSEVMTTSELNSEELNITSTIIEENKHCPIYCWIRTA